MILSLDFSPGQLKQEYWKSMKLKNEIHFILSDPVYPEEDRYQIQNQIGELHLYIRYKNCLNWNIMSKIRQKIYNVFIKDSSFLKINRYYN